LKAGSGGNMRIRRYTGKDIQEAMLKVKMDLGSDAVILNTRKVRKKGIKGIFSKPLTEILAAVDDELGVKKKASETEKVKNTTEDKNRIELLENRLSRMENMLRSLYNDIPNNQNMKISENAVKYENPKVEIVRPASVGNFNVKSVENPFALLTKKLSENDIEPEIIDRIVGNIKLSVRNSENYDEIVTVAEKVIKDMLGQPQTIQLRKDGKPTVVMFWGRQV